MMKLILIAIICVAAGFGGAFVVLGEKSRSIENAGTESAQLYTCGMHPEIVSNEPGVCPICNMNLTPKRDAESDGSSVRIDPTTKQNMGLVTVSASYQSLSHTTRAFGKIEVPDPNHFTVIAKFDGWIEQLYVSEEGERVGQGQPLLSIYSPDLVTAQRELIAAIEGAQGGNNSLTRMAELAEERLRNWDIPEEQIERLKTARQVNREMMLRAPVDGVIVKKPINEGSRVSARTVLYEIADLSNVWVTAFVYEQDLPSIKVGQVGVAQVPAIPSKQFETRVVYVSPVLNNKSQAEVRLVLANPEMNLRPEMYAEVSIMADSEEQRLAIPRKAIINSGERQLVFVATMDGGYEAREVTTGLIGQGDLIEIKSGLSEGDPVVVSGQFLLDSESRLSEAIGANPHAGHGQAPVASEPESKPEDSEISHSGHLQASTDPYDIHTCPMPVHFHVLNYGPGQCSECGMDLVPVEETKNTPVYVCPMPECGVAQKEPGQCPVCNMNLVEYQPEPSND